MKARSKYGIKIFCFPSKWEMRGEGGFEHRIVIVPGNRT